MSANVARSPYGRRIAASVSIVLGVLAAPAYAMVHGSSLRTCEGPTTLSPAYEVPADPILKGETIPIERGVEAFTLNRPYGPGAYVVFTQVVRDANGGVIKQQTSASLSPDKAISPLLGFRRDATGGGATVQFGVHFQAVEGSHFCGEQPAVEFDNALLPTALYYDRLSDVDWQPTPA